jgi:putative transposase
LVESIQHARDSYNFSVLAYIIMPEHAHLVIFPRDESYSISSMLKSIKQSVARRATNYLRDCDSGILRFMETGLSWPRYRFWQNGGGYDRNVRNRDELERLIDYILANPVKKGLVENVEDWYWSSARDWLYGEEKGPILIDRDDVMIM